MSDPLMERKRAFSLSMVLIRLPPLQPLDLVSSIALNHELGSDGGLRHGSDPLSGLTWITSEELVFPLEKRQW